jgi:proteasome lid subunit RPN8/RPN11
VTRREAQQIERLERSGEMKRRREQLRAWFQTHPGGPAQEALRQLGFSHPDHMYVVADSIRMDLLRHSRLAS